VIRSGGGPKKRSKLQKKRKTLFLLAGSSRPVKGEKGGSGLPIETFGEERRGKTSTWKRGKIATSLAKPDANEGCTLGIRQRGGGGGKGKCLNKKKTHIFP